MKASLTIFLLSISLCNSLHAQPGILDPTFGVNGRVLLSYGYNDMAGGLAVQADGKILFGGMLGGITGILRLNSDGTIDSLFGISGFAKADIFSSDLYLATLDGNNITLQPDGKILLCGKPGGSKIAVERFNENGTVDSTFSDDGIAKTNMIGSDEDVASVYVHNSKILVVGCTHDNAGMFIARFNDDGSKDLSFNQTGLFSYGWTYFDFLTFSCAIDDSNRIVVGGSKLQSLSDTFIVTRINWNGTIDSSFGNEGFFKRALTPLNAEYLFEVKIQSDEKIVATAYSYDWSNYLFGGIVFRLNTDGVLDSSFGNNGIVYFSDCSENFTRSCAIQPNGQIVIAGHSHINCLEKQFILRINSDGSIDPTFGTNGVTITEVAEVNNINDLEINNLVMQPDEKFLVSGWFDNFSSQDSVFILRFNGGIATNAEASINSIALLSPNPVQNLLTINLLSPSAAATIAVYDVAGRKIVLPTSNFKSQTSNSIQLTTTTLPNGIYLLQIINNKTGVSEVGKFVKE